MSDVKEKTADLDQVVKDLLWVLNKVVTEVKDHEDEWCAGWFGKEIVTVTIFGYLSALMDSGYITKSGFWKVMDKLDDVMENEIFGDEGDEKRAVSRFS